MVLLLGKIKCESMGKFYFSIFLSLCCFLTKAQVTDQDSTELEEIIPVINLTESDFDDGIDEGVSGLLSASKDVFVQVTDFNLNAARFKIRGYDSENVILHMNGVPMNDLESGWATWSAWGGLNDVTRRQEVNSGLEATNYSFGGVGGGVNIDTRASSQRKQIRGTYTFTNSNNYNHRAMLSYATGMMPNDMAVSMMVSRRWAQEAYIEGVFYDGYSYFLSFDKKLNNHLFNLTFLGASQKRGKQGGAVQELFDLSGTNYYNPYWGFQNGKIRNARVANRHQPLGMLRHDWTVNDKTNISTTVSVQDGVNGSSNLDWYDAADPRPDYYRKLPSAIDASSERGLENQLAIEQIFRDDQAARQIKWDQLYEINSNSIDKNFSESERRSRYAVMERRYDSFKTNFSSTLESVFSEKATLQMGLNYNYFKGDNYQLMLDLLGGDYVVNLDQFAERDFPGDQDIIQHDLDDPNRLIREGDKFGYHYESHIHKAEAWGQGLFTLGKAKVNLGLNISQSRFWRTGLNRNGKFPDSSQGESEKQKFLNYGLKGGLSYGFDGRNFLVANAMHMTRAPFFRDAFVSARTRNQVVPNLKEETVQSGEIAYLYNSPNLKAKIGAYYTNFQDQTEIKSFYHDELNNFVNFIMTGVDKEHIGLELAAEGKIVAGLTYQFGVSLGQFIYNSRPNAIISQDNNAALLNDGKTVYIQNFYVSGTPQKAGTVGIQYETPSKLTFGINANYFDGMWLDFNPDRRSFEAIEVSDINNAIVEGGELWNSIINQEQLPSAYTIDISVRRSFKVADDLYLNANLSVDNILNNQFASNGYEQLRFDFEEKDVSVFPARYFYARGINYFFNFSLTKRL